MGEDAAAADLQLLTAHIVAAYVSNNKVGGEELAALIGSTYQALSAPGAAATEEPQPPKPDKAAIRKSVSPDHLTSFIDGRQYKSLKRHLTGQGLTGAEYRERYGLPADYPMVAPNYSAQRSQLAKTLGLGRKTAVAEPPPVQADPEPAKPARRGRGKAVAPMDESLT